jgi:predicted ester cyclase
VTALTDSNKQMVRTYVHDVINRGINDDGSGRHPDSVDGMLEAFAKYVAADAYDYAAPEMIGPKGAVDTLKVMWTAFPNSHFVIDQLPAEGDQIMIQAVISGTNSGPLMGLPATGKDFSVHALQLFRVVDGKLAQHWGGISMISLMQQLGVYDQILAPRIAEVYREMGRKYIEAINKDDFDLLAEVLSEDFIDEAAVGTAMPQGMEGAKMAHLMLRGAFPDLKFTIDDLMIEGDKLVMVATGSGTNTGSFFGIPPSGKPVSWTGMRILRIKDGKFVSGVAEFDQVGILQQMGVIPSLGPPVDLEANKAVIRRLYEEENKGNVDVIDELMAPDVVIHGDALAPLQKGTAGIKEQVKAVQSVFEGLTVTIEDLVAEGNKVSARLRWRGRQTKDFMGIPATNKEITWTAIAVNRIENGRVAERWFIASTFNLLQQLGIIPPMGTS